jgi:hypothetical protein
MHPVGVYVSGDFVAWTQCVDAGARSEFVGRVRFNADHYLLGSTTHVCIRQRAVAIEALADAVRDGEKLLVMSRPLRLR